MSDTINNSSAYTILVNEDNTMTTTQKRRIVQRSKLVDDLWFLVPQMYNGYNMAVFTVLLEYVLPVSKRYQSDILVLSDSTYNGFLKYHLPVDTVITDGKAGGRAQDLRMSDLSMERYYSRQCFNSPRSENYKNRRAN